MPFCLHDWNTYFLILFWRGNQRRCTSPAHEMWKRKKCPWLSNTHFFLRSGIHISRPYVGWIDLTNTGCLIVIWCKVNGSEGQKDWEFWWYISGWLASRCYFFENWLMKHKWATLVTMQPEIYHQNSQSFYPSEPFKKNHVTMRHPVVARSCN